MIEVWSYSKGWGQESEQNLKRTSRVTPGEKSNSRARIFTTVSSSGHAEKQSQVNSKKYRYFAKRTGANHDRNGKPQNYFSSFTFLIHLASIISEMPPASPTDEKK